MPMVLKCRPESLAHIAEGQNQNCHLASNPLRPRPRVLKVLTVDKKNCQAIAIVAFDLLGFSLYCHILEELFVCCVSHVR